ncbi:MAG: S-adenosylmethionine:tRNA ribosyltransferase-isomerase [Actinomycetota bacterium]
MKTSELIFDRPESLQATAPPEARGHARDDVRLLVSTPAGHKHAMFRDIASFLQHGDLIVVNDSATLPASLEAFGDPGRFILNVSTRFGPKVWLTEPRWATDRPGPLPLHAGDRICACDETVRMIAPYPGAERLWFVEGDLARAMNRCGQPIRYAYVDREQPLTAYQTLFARAPGSAEMPSAARPFTKDVVRSLIERGVAIKTIRLHTGVSSLEIETEEVESHTLPPEPFRVPTGTADAVNEAREEGRRVIAVGTTVVRALESAWSADLGRVVPKNGYTRLLVHPGRGVFAVDGLLTGFHDPGASHLAMLYAVAGKDLVRDGYEEAINGGYLWHEFGDSHLLLPK